MYSSSQPGGPPPSSSKILPPHVSSSTLRSTQANHRPQAVPPSMCRDPRVHHSCRNPKSLYTNDLGTITTPEPSSSEDTLPAPRHSKRATRPAAHSTARSPMSRVSTPPRPGAKRPGDTATRAKNASEGNRADPRASNVGVRRVTPLVAASDRLKEGSEPKPPPNPFEASNPTPDYRSPERRGA